MIFNFNKPIRKLLFAYFVSISIIALLLVIQQIAHIYNIYPQQISLATAISIVLILLLQVVAILSRAVVKIDRYVAQISRANDELTKSLSQKQVLEKELRRKADELSSMNEVLQVGEERFRKLIEYNTVGIFIHDGQHIVYANPECTKILGRDMYSLFKTPMLGIIHPDFQKISERKLAQMRKLKMKKTMTLRADIQVINSAGESRWIDLSTSNAYEKSSFIATITDITERKRANDQLQDANQTIARRNEQLNNVLTEFKKQQEALMKQAESLHLANNEISNSQKELANKNKIIEKKNEDIMASINYAKRIQQAILPTTEEIDSLLNNYFILYKPLDIVSGDFYWVAKKHYKLILVIADCTGHGIPGAFMSLIGNDLLNEIVNTRNITSPELILEELRKDIQRVLRQGTTLVQDGMDIAICTIDQFSPDYEDILGKPKLEFAGASNPVVLIQNDELIYIRGDNIPIGGYHPKNSHKKFTKHSFNLDVPTTLYMFSDGYQDQFGGESNSKFGSKRLREMLFTIRKKPIKEQKEFLEANINTWLGEPHRQIDDILVLGAIIDSNKVK
ncbi:MAG: PAS domain S-box protein [Cytophagales bacterium]|nr:MAG: PAS domain S-box protein [Cytophagales bacterium]